MRISMRLLHGLASMWRRATSACSALTSRVTSVPSGGRAEAMAMAE